MAQTHEDKKRIVADRVAYILYVKGLNQVQLSKILGVSHTTIQNYVNQVTLPDANKLKLLAGLLDMTVEEFMKEA